MATFKARLALIVEFEEEAKEEETKDGDVHEVGFGKGKGLSREPFDALA